MEGYTNFTKLHAEEIVTDTLALGTKIEAIADITDTATGKEIAAAVNSLIAALVSAGLLEAAAEE